MRFLLIPFLLFVSTPLFAQSYDLYPKEVSRCSLRICGLYKPETRQDFHNKQVKITIDKSEFYTITVYRLLQNGSYSKRYEVKDVKMLRHEKNQLNIINHGKGFFSTCDPFFKEFQKKMIDIEVILPGSENSYAYEHGTMNLLMGDKLVSLRLETEELLALSDVLEITIEKESKIREENWNW